MIKWAIWTIVCCVWGYYFGYRCEKAEHEEQRKREERNEQDPEEVNKDTLIKMLQASNKELVYQLTRLRNINEAYKELVEELLERTEARP